MDKILTFIFTQNTSFFYNGGKNTCIYADRTGIQMANRKSFFFFLSATLSGQTRMLRRSQLAAASCPAQ
jgi:hypothetical protein